MSTEALAIAFHHSRAHGPSKLVLLGIANHDGDGGAWPAVSTLAVYANTDRANVQKYIRNLQKLGEVEVEFQAGGTRDTRDYDRPNLYKFVLKCPPNCDGTTKHKALCWTCNKPLPNDHRRAGFHAGCPRAVELPPRGRSTSPPGVVLPPELSTNPNQPLNNERSVLNRARDDRHPVCVIEGHSSNADRSACTRCGAAFVTFKKGPTA